MLFYEISGVIKDKTWAEENNDSRTKRERIRQIAWNTRVFNSSRDNYYCFVASINDSLLTCGIISLDLIDFEKTAKTFIKATGIHAEDLKLKETMLKSISTLLCRASREDFIPDSDEVLEQFGIERYNRYSEYDYAENMIASTVEKNKLYLTSEIMLTGDTLRQELDRIYSGKSSSRAFGHPVHYFVESDDSETSGAIYRILLDALYDNNRLKSRRYCSVEISSSQQFRKKLYNSIYRSSENGAVVVRFTPDTVDDDDDDDDEYADPDEEMIGGICEAMLRYRNSVLTVFCLPRSCEKLKRIFYENLGPVGMVDIRENLADYEDSCRYLDMLCRERHIRTDKKLYSGLSGDRLYLPGELRTMFEEWYNRKIRTSVYPQYRNIQVSRKEAVMERPKGSAYDSLNEMIGLKEAKEVINKALDYYKLQKVYKDRGIPQDRPAMHMVFTGNPGTAKTTVARLFARIMKENGLLSKGHLVEVGRGDLVGRYVGWTASIVKDKFKKATGGVLFIDEAYSLVDDKEGLYGDEAINTIVQEMENRREDIVVIFAGYTDKMEKFIKRNPGLRSRIAFHIPFADYDSSELCEIARIIGKSKGMTLSDGAVAKLSGVFDIARKQSDFGNGRYVRNIIECSKMNQARRIIAMDPDKVTDRMLTEIEESDIEIPNICTGTKKKPIGFAC